MSDVVLTGARSQIGVFLLPLLVEAGFEINAVSRSAPSAERSAEGAVRWVRPDADPGPARYLFSCGPLDLARRFLERSGSFRKAVVFSTTSVLTKRLSGDRAERAQIAAIASEEDALCGHCEKRGIELVLLRPTMVYGCGLDRNVSLLLKFGEGSGFIPVSGSARGRRQPVHAEDLAQLALDCLRADTGAHMETAAPGGETLAYGEMARRVAACGQRSIRVVSVPAPMLVGLVRIAVALGFVKGLSPEMVHRQAIDMVFEAANLPASLTWKPRPFEPTSNDFNIPEKFRVNMGSE